MHQSITDMTSPDSRQYSEVWPGGRTNHYWFDLNRDYLPLVHPETRGRVEKYHEWKPNVVTDHHEMGANTTFFFQPGVPSRNNPLTPARNYELTHKIADIHTKYLDRIGAAYFSEESFDDYYFGKGSSYPDVNGSVGILFEQAGFRGRIRETENGLRTLAYAIRNQFTVSLSTLDGALLLKKELLSFQKDFYEEALRLAESNQVKAYLFGNENDRINNNALIELLNRHQIDVYRNEKDVYLEGKNFKAGSSFIVPVKQKQFRLIQTLFEEVNTFADSAFYDISTWTFPYAYNIPFARLTSLTEVHPSADKVSAQRIRGSLTGEKSHLAYLFRWNEYLAPAALYLMQKEGLITKVASEEFTITLNGKSEKFSRGTIIIPADNQLKNHEEIYNVVVEVANKTGVDFFGVKTGRTAEGINLGSSSFILLKKPEIIMAAGNGINSREAGELWHLMDYNYQIPVCLAEPSSFRQINLSRYNVLILPGGSPVDLSGETATKIKNWVEDGGTLIVSPGAISWATRNELSKIKFKKGVEPDSTRFLSYSDRQKESSLNAIAGAIFNADMDLTHPLCYGFQQDKLPVFKTGNQVAEKLQDKFAVPVHFNSQPYLSGFVSAQNLERIHNAPVVTVESVGKGRVISFHESMAFRGMWRGTARLFSNAVIFGNTIR